MHLTYIYLLIPGISSSVGDKRDIFKIFAVTLILALFFYCFVGIVISSYFGDDTQSAANLNWQNYKGI
jgi:hypothetical protein